MVFIDTIFTCILTFFIIYYITFYIVLVYYMIEEEWFCKNKLPIWRDKIILKYKNLNYSRLVNIIDPNESNESKEYKVSDEQGNKVIANEIIKQIDLNIQTNNNKYDK